MEGIPVASPDPGPCSECNESFPFFVIVALVVIIAYILIFAIIDQCSHNRRRRRRRALIGPNRPPQIPDEKRIKEIAIGCTECAICLGEYGCDENGVIRRTLKPCGHRFHQACIDVWLVHERRCPVCRVLLSNESSVSVHGKQSVAT